MPMLTKNDICPFVQEPFDECYCYNLTSRFIDSAIYYCGNHFKSCEIYKRNRSDKDLIPDNGTDPQIIN